MVVAAIPKSFSDPVLNKVPPSQIHTATVHSHAQPVCELAGRQRLCESLYFRSVTPYRPAWPPDETPDDEGNTHAATDLVRADRDARPGVGARRAPAGLRAAFDAGGSGTYGRARQDSARPLQNTRRLRNHLVGVNPLAAQPDPQPHRSRRAPRVGGRGCLSLASS